MSYAPDNDKESAAEQGSLNLKLGKRGPFHPNAASVFLKGRLGTRVQGRMEKGRQVVKASSTTAHQPMSVAWLIGQQRAINSRLVPYKGFVKLADINTSQHGLWCISIPMRGAAISCRKETATLGLLLVRYINESPFNSIGLLIRLGSTRIFSKHMQITPPSPIEPQAPTVLSLSPKAGWSERPGFSVVNRSSVLPRLVIYRFPQVLCNHLCRNWADGCVLTSVVGATLELTDRMSSPTSTAAHDPTIPRPTTVPFKSRSLEPSRARMLLFKSPLRKHKAAMDSSPLHPFQAPTQSPFLQSPAAIPPRTTSSNFSVSTVPPSSANPNSKSISESNWLSGSAASTSQTTTPGHTRHQSRKASVTSSTSFPSNAMAQQSPPPDPSRFATEDFFLNTKRLWTEQKDKVLTAPYDYLNGHPGKDFRSALVNAFDAFLEVPKESKETITKVVSMLHTASLLVDDVEDNSLLRRGLPVAHTIYGIPQTINSSNYIYFVALQELQKLKNPKVVNIFAEELLNLHRGQGMDLYWRDTLTCPTEDEYLEMVGNKTGGLFRLGIKLMQAESRSLTDCIPLVNVIGLIFQIADDYQNLWSKEYTANKGMCEDLTEGKFSFPVIHSIRSNPSNSQLLNILRQKTTNEEVKRYAVSYMQSTGSFEYTKKVVYTLIERARRMADELDEGRGRAALVHKILDRVVIE
ncbi:isoprenoid synthase domain-containing protein [Triangularia setosa]|uniref:Isoprenoid synthase domain-containing protein n=1 Tax=Triangularia setosa TaxID=2587417 RepID=A0AAN6WC12_9PEZI|nr:isoprenoid synthase domain-containing protein [Podospora setosa]